MHIYLWVVFKEGGTANERKYALFEECLGGGNEGDQPWAIPLDPLDAELR